MSALSHFIQNIKVCHRKSWKYCRARYVLTAVDKTVKVYFSFINFIEQKE